MWWRTGGKKSYQCGHMTSKTGTCVNASVCVHVCVCTYVDVCVHMCLFSSSVCWKNLKAKTPQQEWAHPAPRSWPLRPFLTNRNQGSQEKWLIFPGLGQKRPRWARNASIYQKTGKYSKKDDGDRPKGCKGQFDRAPTDRMGQFEHRDN